MIVGFAGLVMMEYRNPASNLDITYDFGWLRCLLGFIAGMGVYQLYRARTGARFLRTDSACLGAALLTIALLHWSALDALVVPALIFLLLAAVHNDGKVKRALSAKPMVFLGDASYSIYMVQVACLFLVWAGILTFGTLDATGVYNPSLAVRVMLLALSVSLTLGLSTFTYRFIEVPAREWLRHRAA